MEIKELISIISLMISILACVLSFFAIKKQTYSDIDILTDQYKSTTKLKIYNLLLSKELYLSDINKEMKIHFPDMIVDIDDLELLVYEMLVDNTLVCNSNGSYMSNSDQVFVGNY